MSGVRGKDRLGRADSVFLEALWVVGVVLALLVVVGVPAGLYRLGKLDLSEAFTVGASLTLALFTIALWRATAEQARATREMQKLSWQLAQADRAPLLFIKAELIAQQEVEGDYFFNIVELTNGGRYGIVLHRVRWLVEGVVFRIPQEWNKPIVISAGERLNSGLPQFDFEVDAMLVRDRLIADKKWPGFALEIDYSYGGIAEKVSGVVVSMTPLQPLEIERVEEKQGLPEGARLVSDSGDWGVPEVSYWVGVLRSLGEEIGRG